MIRQALVARWVWLPLTAALGWLPGVADAQLFSPGQLAADHAHLEGLGNCDRCHSGAEQVDDQRCLRCHRPLAARVSARRGYHGRASTRSKACASCHPDHRGRAFKMVTWPGGAPERFPHSQAGWPLKGAHTRVPCADCHTARRVRDPAVEAWLAQHAGTETYLGLGRACTDCHADEHRGQLKGPCERCHDQRAFAPARGFDHAASWPLLGKHARQPCESCHPGEQDAAGTRAFPATRAVTFARYRPVAAGACTDCHEDPHRGRLGSQCRACHGHETWRMGTPTAQAVALHAKTRFPLRGGHVRVACEACHPRRPEGGAMLLAPVPHSRCQDCHRDPHEGRLGADCEGCHTETSWRVPKVGGRLADFHDRTAFPLRDAHRRVPCAPCHPRDRKGAQILRPIAHERCADCHTDAHPERASLPAPQRRCEGCHDGVSFQPATYGAKEHADSRFPLQGAHALVACPVCHAQRMVPTPRPEPAPGASRRSPWAMRSPWGEGAGGCPDCHPDPHRRQLAERPCQECHGAESWAVQGRFDHTKQSRFPLQGRHVEVACVRCHPAETDGEGSFIRYRPLPLQCAGCHADLHLAQFRLLHPARGCPDCHTVEGFKPARFDHQDPARTTFPLRGAHKEAECPSCHPLVSFAGGVSAAHYRPLPLRCDRCHVDPHEGRYQAMAPLTSPPPAPPSPLRARAGEALAAPARSSPAWRLPAGGPTSETTPRTDCAVCHEERAWWPARFDHDTTSFPLRGLHQGLPCGTCHAGPDSKHPPRDCAGCHSDAHGRRLSADCARCHDAGGFVDVWRAAALHDQTRMPLQGRHATLACQECHQNLRELGFVGTPLACEGCHLRDRPAAGLGLDHEAPGFGGRCRGCHITASWRIASLPAHDRCFPILSGDHAFVPCRSCHRGQLPAVVDMCTTGRFSCSGCHGCGDHEGVPGYQCKERKCYECHPDGEQ